MKALLLVVLACFTKLEMDNAVCKNLCLSRHDGGYSRNAHCYCIDDEGLMSDFAHGQIKVQREWAMPEPEEKPVEVRLNW